MFAKKLKIHQTWDGTPVEPRHHINLQFRVNNRELILHVEAPFYNDPTPKSPSGLTHGLWEYELVELFLLGEDDHYLEIELGPHGHYLVYFLTGVRKVERTVVPLSVSCHIEENVWHGEIRIARVDLPVEISHVNGYGLHGLGAKRVYLAATPVLGDKPDFHQPHVFISLATLPD